jgi:threonine dehydrogenase-like Zn-dependent dehydrogenase
VRAVVVYPGQGRAPELTDVPAPELGPGRLRVRVLSVGVCGTDREILAGGHGAPPPGQTRLVLGHESFGQVEETRAASAPFSEGDYVVATVRRGCDRCDHCRAGMSDFCDTGGFVERGILGMDGFLADRYVEDPAYLVRVPAALAEVGVLLEPLSVVEKALQQAYAAQARIPGRPTGDLSPWRVGPGSWRLDRALVLGAGPIGMLAALSLKLLGAPEVVVVERSVRPAKGALLQSAGARYVSTGGAPLRDVLGADPFDLVLEATGSGRSVLGALPLLAANGVACLTGIFAAGEPPEPVAINDLLRGMVYRNKAIVTSVNSNRSYFERGVESMAALEARWPGLLAGLITRRMPIERYAEAVQPERDGVKTVIDLAWPGQG